ncbi:MAG TPA: hypothetical protein VM182_00230, partial [Terriglobia bacterium]|nr:hypothetical protein [Terriglobia bacterium]
SLGPGTTAVPTASAAGLIDSVLAGGVKSGYSFSYTPGAVVGGRIDTYSINANPVTAGTTGTNFYFTDHSGVIRQNSAAAATATDSPLAG